MYDIASLMCSLFFSRRSDAGIHTIPSRDCYCIVFRANFEIVCGRSEKVTQRLLYQHHGPAGVITTPGGGPLISA